ncbi:MAG: sensor histidine kinase [Ignavibacteriaceae bacterium]|nr:sensor histidine kinase [Ignavibacteriaceae bacterium]
MNSTEIDALKKRVLQLEIENQNCRLEKEEMFKNLNKIIQEKDKFQREHSNLLLKEQELRNISRSYEIIIDELAHSINSDIFIAVNFLSRSLDNPKIKKADSHIKQVRDLNNLLMTYLKRDELQFSGQFKEIVLEQVLNEQIELIKNSLSTLRISSDEHEENLEKLIVTPEIKGNSTVLIVEEFASALSLIVKDLIRNAFKHTNEENPEITVSLEDNESYVILLIKNNRAIDPVLADWFNNNSLADPQNMSKSSKVGLRVVKKWVDLLKIPVKYVSNKKDDYTTVEVKFPKRIAYDKI